MAGNQEISAANSLFQKILPLSPCASRFCRGQGVSPSTNRNRISILPAVAKKICGHTTGAPASMGEQILCARDPSLRLKGGFARDDSGQGSGAGARPETNSFLQERTASDSIPKRRPRLLRMPTPTSADLRAQNSWQTNCFPTLFESQSRRRTMAHFERIRDVMSGPFSPEIIRQRTAAGWKMVSVEWRRELPESEAPTEGAFAEDIPYGLRISDDCQRLEIDPTENRTLMLMMELLVQDFSYSSIVSDLNEKGLRMRDGRPWTRVAVFNMTPRLIEVGPRLFATDEWVKMRQKFSAPKAPGAF